MTAIHHKVRYKQYLILGLVALGLMGCLAALMWSLSSDASKVVDDTPSGQETAIESAGSRLNSQAIWVERLEADSKALKEKVHQMEQKIEEATQQASSKEEELRLLREEFRSLLEMQKMETEVQSSAAQAPPPFSGESFPLSSSPQKEEGDYRSGNVIKKVVINFSKTSKRGSGQKKTVENTIPAGAFAKAVLLGGIDASTSIQAASDPRPLLLRVMDAGTLPRRFKSDLKNCHVLASSYGDLSSERVYMRLEKLTCTEPLTGEIIETQVAGYVSGEDGRAGVRGTIVDRAGEVLRNSLVGGFVSGISQFLGLQQQRSVFPASPLGPSQALSPQAMLSAGAASGVGNAMEKYSEFFIKRAEQLQPVIQVAAGRQVDIVFTEGTAFGETRVKKVLGRLREESRRETLSTLEKTQDDKQWLPLPSSSEGGSRPPEF